MTGESKTERRFRWWSVIWIPLLTAVVGALAATLSTWWYAEWSNRQRTLQYFTLESPAIIKKPTLQAKSFQILLDGKEIDNVSILSVFLYNDTDQDFDDVPFDVVLKAPASNSAKLPTLIHVDPKMPPAAFVETKLADNSDGSMGFSYLIHVVNRSKQPVFQVDYAFEGPVCPDTSVDVRKKGVNISFVDPRQLSQPAKWVQNLTGGALLGVLASLVVFFSRWKVLDLPEKIKRLRNSRRIRDPELRTKYEDTLRQIAAAEDHMEQLAEEAMSMKQQAKNKALPPRAESR